MFRVLRIDFPGVPYATIHELPAATITLAKNETEDVEYKTDPLYHQWKPTDIIEDPDATVSYYDRNGYHIIK